MEEGFRDLRKAFWVLLNLREGLPARFSLSLFVATVREVFVAVFDNGETAGPVYSVAKMPLDCERVVTGIFFIQ